MVANGNFSERHIQGWSTPYNSSIFYLTSEAGVATSIAKPMVAMNGSMNEAYYTLQGMKVACPTKGIYIHNGKKVVIK